MSAPGPAVVWPPGLLWRVARTGKGFTYAEVDLDDAREGRGVNRFDVAGSGVLYASTDIEGCYREVLARMRPARGMVDLDEDNSNAFMAAGQLPASWRENRRRFALAVDSDLPFVDVEQQVTWNAIEATPGALPPFDPKKDDGHLDIGDIRGGDRRLTQRIARWAYDEESIDGKPRYAGIRYMSRTGNFECWAIFQRPAVQVVEVRPAGEIDINDPDLSRVCRAFELTPH